jgi:hypothetical protein
VRLAGADRAVILTRRLTLGLEARRPCHPNREICAQAMAHSTALTESILGDQRDLARRRRSAAVHPP